MMMSCYIKYNIIIKVRYRSDDRLLIEEGDFDFIGADLPVNQSPRHLRWWFPATVAIVPATTNIHFPQKQIFTVNYTTNSQDSMIKWKNWSQVVPIIDQSTKKKQQYTYLVSDS